MIDVHHLITEVKKRDDIRIEPGDPAFVLMTLNQLVFEDFVAKVGEHIRAGIAEFTSTVLKTEAHAGKILAQEVKAAAAELRQELQRDIDSARVDAKTIVHEVHRIHRRAALIRWGAVGIISGAALFTAGLWLGAQCLK